MMEISDANSISCFVGGQRYLVTGGLALKIQ